MANDASTGPLVTDAKAQAALEYMSEAAKPTAKAIADVEYLREYRKSLKAMLMEKVDGPVNAQERFAYGHPDYVQHVKLLQEAIFKAERLKYLYRAAQTTVEVWRTECANSRIT